MGYRLDGLKAARVSAGLTVTRLAQKANTSDFTINRAEAGEPQDPDVCKRLADALGTTVVAGLGGAAMG